MTDTLLLTIPEAAAQLRVNRRTIERMLGQGKLRTIRPNGGRRRIIAADLDAYIARLAGEVASNRASNGAGIAS